MKLFTSYHWLVTAFIFVTVKAITFNKTGFTNATISYSVGKKAACITGFLPINVTANNINLLTTGPSNNFETTELFIKYTQTNSTIVSDFTGNTIFVTGTYNIFSKLCFPAVSTNLNSSAENVPKTVQILTHGGTLDINYWNLATPNNSYIDVAATAGYATFSYARLGTSPSDRPDGIQIVQMAIQVEILHQLTLMLRNGKLGYMFSRVVGVGHSIGAGLSQGITTKYPADFDAVVLSGHSTSFADAIVGSIGTGMQLADLDGSSRFEGLGNGYFTLGGGLSAHQYSFYKYPYFDVDRKFSFRTREAFSFHTRKASGFRTREVFSSARDICMPPCFQDSNDDEELL